MDRRSRKAKAAIDQALILSLKKENIRDIQVKKIAELADISRSTFYQHYSSIYEVIEQMENEIILKIKVYCKDFPRISLRELIINIANYIKSDKERINILLTKTDDHFKNKIKRAFQVFENIYTASYLGKDVGRYYHCFIIEGAIGIFALWVKEGCRIPIEELYDDLLKLFKEFPTFK